MRSSYNSFSLQSLACQLFFLVLAAFLIPTPFGRGEEEDIYAELVRRSDYINDLLMKELADREWPDVPEYPDRLLSLRRNAQVTLGGEARTVYAYSRSRWRDPGFNPALPNGGKSAAKTGDLSLTTAKLLIDVRAGERWRAYFDLDLNGYHGLHQQTRVVNENAPGQPFQPYTRRHDADIFSQGYVELLKDGHSGLGFRAGRMKLPFGLWTRPNLFAQSFMDAPDLTGSYLMNPEAWNSAVRLPHASRLVEPVLAAQLSYEMRDIIRFEAAVFRETDENLGYRNGGSGRYRTESYAPRSWQIGASILPLEGWELTANFRNRYSRSRGVRSWSNSAYRWDFSGNLASGRGDPKWDGGQWSDTGTGESFGSRSNEQAFIVGLAVEIPNTQLSVQTEYAHGWNQGFNKYIHSDAVSLGFAYRLTPFLTLHAQGDWLQVKDRSWMGSNGAGGSVRDNRNNRLYRGFAGAEYELSGGLTLEGGWQYEYWQITSSRGGLNGAREERLNTTNMLYFGTRFIF